MSAPWKPLDGNRGLHHDWTSVPHPIPPSSFERFEKDYTVAIDEKDRSKSRFFTPTAIYFCEICHICVPQSGPRPEDQDCHIIVVREIMES